MFSYLPQCNHVPLPITHSAKVIHSYYHLCLTKTKYFSRLTEIVDIEWTVSCFGAQRIEYLKTMN